MSISSISPACGGWNPPPAPVPPLHPTARAPAGSSATTSDVAASPRSSVLSALTPSDRSLIAAATGVVISPDGTVVSGAGYVGSGGTAEQFISVIAAARQLGAVQGRITPAELASLFPPYVTTGPNATIDSAHVANAAQYLEIASAAQPSTTAGSLEARA